MTPSSPVHSPSGAKAPGSASTRGGQFHTHPLLRRDELHDNCGDPVSYQLSSDAERQRVGHADGELPAQCQISDWKRDEISTVDIIVNSGPRKDRPANSCSHKPDKHIGRADFA